MKLKQKLVGIVAGTALAFGGIVASAPPAQTATLTHVCLSTKSYTYAYLNAWFYGWSFTRFINRGECSYNEMPGWPLKSWMPGAGTYCKDIWGRYYWNGTAYPGRGLTMTCYQSSGSW